MAKPCTYLSKSTKPLKILTLDGGGLQAISTLVILDKLLETIAENNSVPHKKPRPCDVFDTIAGIGAGGWLAILLGRFHMDITTCLSEWYKITHSIAPRSKTEGARMRAFKHCYFNLERLMEQVDGLTKEYGMGNLLFDHEERNVRTKHVFVAALRSDSKGYNLFRTYPLPVSGSARLLGGPENPSTFKVSSAFGVTGSAKYFSPPWKEQMEGGRRRRFMDSKFPKPHNITELALDEMWGLYGTKVALSLVVNIGPGLPSNSDVIQIARRFSWGLDPTISKPGIIEKGPRPPNILLTRTEKKPHHSTNVPTPTVHFQAPDSGFESSAKPLSHNNTFGSIKDRDLGIKLRRLETDIEKDIKIKLDNVYPERAKEDLYFRLAPEMAPTGTAQNDSRASGVCLNATVEYLGRADVEERVDIVGRRLSEDGDDGDGV